MIIHTNIDAIKTEGKLKNNNTKNAKALERLSSGLKINRAADDSAGLTISEKMRAQIRGLNQASRNLQDGISFVQTADGALSTVHDILMRGKELCVQGANDTNTAEDRQKINEELKQLNAQIDRVGTDTEFNTLKVFTKGITPADEDLFKMIAETWVASALDAIQATFNTFDAAGSGKLMNIVFADLGKGTMASMSASGPAGAPTGFTLRINVNYFNPALKDDYVNSGGGTAATGYELYDKIIAHEMMHGVMFDTMWNNIVGTNATIPSWFMEGTAEAVGGGFYRIANMTDAAVQNGLGAGGLYDYSSGYAASMYLGYLAGGGGVNNTDIAAGLDKIFAELAAGSTFDQALQNTISMNSSQFISDFKTSGGTAATFLNDLRTAVNAGGTPGPDGTVGSGSLLASFTTNPEATISDFPNPATSGGFFTVSNQLTAIDATLIIQSGANTGQDIKLERFGLSADALGLPSASTMGTQQSYDNAIASYDNAVSTVSNIRSYYGAAQNRMEYSTKNVDNYAENLQVSESRIRDANMSLTMVEFTKTNILSQAAMAMLAQANQTPQNILSLLR